MRLELNHYRSKTGSGQKDWLESHPRKALMKWRQRRSVSFPYQHLGFCRARINDKFRPRYSAGVYRTYSFVYAILIFWQNLSVSEQISKRKFIILLCYIFLFCFLYFLLFKLLYIHCNAFWHPNTRMVIAPSWFLLYSCFLITFSASLEVMIMQIINLQSSSRYHHASSMWYIVHYEFLLSPCQASLANR